jgi:hypothetical protein
MMNADKMGAARNAVNTALADYARYPTTENGSRAKRAIKELRQLASKVAADRLRREQSHLAHSVRRLAPVPHNADKVH